MFLIIFQIKKLSCMGLSNVLQHNSLTSFWPGILRTAVIKKNGGYHAVKS